MNVRALLVLVLLALAPAYAVGQGAGLVAPRTVAPVAVVALRDTAGADLVLLSSGHDAGLRQGMVLRVDRDGEPVARLLVVDLRARSSTALIVDLAPERALRPGDIAVLRLTT